MQTVLFRPIRPKTPSNQPCFAVSYALSQLRKAINKQEVFYSNLVKTAQLVTNILLIILQ